MATFKVGDTGRTYTPRKNTKTKGAPKSKRPGANNGPARQRYWASGRLKEHKVRALMKYNKMTRAEASEYWERARKGRRK